MSGKTVIKSDQVVSNVKGVLTYVDEGGSLRKAPAKTVEIVSDVSDATPAEQQADPEAPPIPTVPATGTSAEVPGDVGASAASPVVEETPPVPKKSRSKSPGKRRKAKEESIHDRIHAAEQQDQA